MSALVRPFDLRPPQGDTDLCWAASLVAAATYQRYALPVGAHDVLTARGLEAFVESVADDLGLPPARTGFIGTAGTPGAVERLAARLGVSLGPIPTRARAEVDAYVERWVGLDCPVILRWTPSAAGILTHDGAHFSVVTRWDPDRVVLADPYGGRRGDTCVSRRVPGWPASDAGRGLQAVAVRPA